MPRPPSEKRLMFRELEEERFRTPRESRNEEKAKLDEERR